MKLPWPLRFAAAVMLLPFEVFCWVLRYFGKKKGGTYQ